MLVHGNINLLNGDSTAPKASPAVRKVVVIHPGEKALTPIVRTNRIPPKVIQIKTSDLSAAKQFSSAGSSSSLDSSPSTTSQPETPTTIKFTQNISATTTYQPKLTPYVPSMNPKNNSQDINMNQYMRNWADSYVPQYTYQQMVNQQSMQQQIYSNPYQYQQSSQNSGWAFQYSSYNYLPNSAYYYQYQQQQVVSPKTKKDVNYSNDSAAKNKTKDRKAKAMPVPQFVMVDVKINDKPLKEIPRLPYPNKNFVERPTAVQFMDKNSELHNMTCTCKSAANEGTLIQCRMCKNFMHLTCVNIAREDDEHPFICPFCLRKRIDCSCNDNLNYSVPLIQCTSCGMWVHKACEGLGFGRNPENFKCKKCGGNQYNLPFPKIKENKQIMTSLDCDTFELISAIPDGNFRHQLVEDLNHSELNYQEMIAKYVNKYADMFISGSAEFWNVFVDIFTSLFQVDAECINNSIDKALVGMLYGEQKQISYSFKPFTCSESIAEFVDSAAVTTFDKAKEPVKIYIDKIDDCVKSPVSLSDNEFICDLPGFVMHTDEVDADSGIPPNIINIHDTDVVVSLTGESAKIASKIKRSLRPNCIAKFYKVKDEFRVGLFTARIAGPNEDKPRRDEVIKEKADLRLPLDGEIPFPIQKTLWRDKKQIRKSKDSKNKKAKTEIQSSLSLLSGFLDDEVPSIPIQITMSDETNEKRKQYLNWL